MDKSQLRQKNSQMPQKRFVFSGEDEFPSFDGSKFTNDRNAFKDSKLSHFNSRTSNQSEQVSGTLHSSHLSYCDENLPSEVIFLKQKIQAIEAEKQLHIQNHAKEKAKLQSQIADLRLEIREINKNSSREICALKGKQKNIEKEIKSLRDLSQQKVHYYKNKIEQFEQNFKNTVQDRDLVIDKLNAKLAEHSPMCKRKKHKSSVSRCGKQTHRAKTPTYEREQDNFRPEQSHYSTKREVPSKNEIDRLKLLLKSSEFKLRQDRNIL